MSATCSSPAIRPFPCCSPSSCRFCHLPSCKLDVDVKMRSPHFGLDASLPRPLCLLALVCTVPTQGFGLRYILKFPMTTQGVREDVSISLWTHQKRPYRSGRAPGSCRFEDGLIGLYFKSPVPECVVASHLGALVA